MYFLKNIITLKNNIVFSVLKTVEPNDCTIPHDGYNEGVNEDAATNYVIHETSD